MTEHLVITLTRKEANMLYFAAQSISDDLREYLPDGRDQMAWERALDKLMAARQEKGR